MGRGMLLPESKSFSIYSLIFLRYSTGIAFGMVADGLWSYIYCYPSYKGAILACGLSFLGDVAASSL